jgi:hypothetical protein
MGRGTVRGVCEVNLAEAPAGEDLLMVRLKGRGQGRGKQEIGLQLWRHRADSEQRSLRGVTPAARFDACGPSSSGPLFFPRRWRRC